MWLLHTLVLMSLLKPNIYDNFNIHTDYVDQEYTDSIEL